MPNLSEMFDRCNKKTNYRWSASSVWEALNEAGFYVFAAVLKENRGFFIKFDTSSIVLVPGTQEYDVPADCTQIIHLAERLSSTENWHTIRTTSLDNVISDQLSTAGTWMADGYYGPDSMFKFYGPYLDSSDTINQSPDIDNSTQTQKIMLQPQIDVQRFCEIVYSAKWLPIIDNTSSLMLPEEGTHAMYNFAMASLCGDGNDDREESFYSRGEQHLSMFLTWVRDRQLQDGPKVSPYLG